MMTVELHANVISPRFAGDIIGSSNPRTGDSNKPAQASWPGSPQLGDSTSPCPPGSSQPGVSVSASTAPGWLPAIPSIPGTGSVPGRKLSIMSSGEPTLDQLRRDVLPLRGRAAVVTGVSRRAGIGYAIARRLAALEAHLFLQHRRGRLCREQGRPRLDH